MPGSLDETIAVTRSPESGSMDEETASATRAPTHAGWVEPKRGALVGRYVVLARLGAGAMGVVLAAYDPQLDRKVAVKLLEHRERDPSKAQSRLYREAQALAKLNHVNVVTVHDVGVHEGQVFLAMEFVEGRTFGQWMRSAGDGRPRPWREVVAVFEAAGRGLAAAHATGLVHRDFKPDNVMIGDDGRVRVMDFGLARTGEHDISPSEELEDIDTGHHDALGEPLTKTGAVMGTPAYMAPEQYAGNVTARSDQFSYCVTLFEALHGKRPFPGQTLAAFSGPSGGKARELPRGAAVPPWLRKVVARGLAEEPADRFPDMDELLLALRTGELRRRRRKWMLAGLGVALAAVTTVGIRHYDRVRRIDACTEAGEAIDEIWTPQAREAMRASILATGVGYAPTVVEKALPGIDAYAVSWRESTTTACMNATVHERWDAAMLDKATWCLEEGRLELSTWVTELASGVDEQMVAKVMEAVTGLSTTTTCLDEAALANAVDPPPPDLRPRVTGVRQQLARTGYLIWAGRYDESLEVAREALREAEALSWAPLTASARAREAKLLANTGAYAESEAAGVRAYMEGAESGAWALAAASASNLVVTVGLRRGRPIDGKVWAEHAAMAIRHAGDPSGLLEAHRLTTLGTLHQSLGENAEAEAAFERALAIWEDSMGPNDPLVGVGLNSLGTVYWSMGRYDEAMAQLERALAIWEQTLGTDHPEVAVTVSNIGNGLRRLGKLEEARARLEQGLAIRERALGPEHPAVAMSLNSLGALDLEMGNLEQAKARHERALSIRQASLGPEHLDVALSVDQLAWVHLAMGEHERAKERFEQALAIREALLEPEDLDLAYSRTGLGTALLELGEHEAAIEPLERAAATWSTEGDPAKTRKFLAESRFALARALWDAPQAGAEERTRALGLAEQAREGFEANGEGSAEDRAQVERWLAEHSKGNPDAESPLGGSDAHG